jgi:hypothetical protein
MRRNDGYILYEIKDGRVVLGRRISSDAGSSGQRRSIWRGVGNAGVEVKSFPAARRYIVWACLTAEIDRL